jgi:hypothetical protein
MERHRGRPEVDEVLSRLEEAVRGMDPEGYTGFSLRVLTLLDVARSLPDAAPEKWVQEARMRHAEALMRPPGSRLTLVP